MTEEIVTTLPFSVLTPEVRAALLKAAKDHIAANPDAMDKFHDAVKEMSRKQEIDGGKATDRLRVENPALFTAYQKRNYSGKMRAILMDPSLREDGAGGGSMPKITILNDFLTPEVTKAIEAELDKADAHNEKFGLETHPHHKQARERLKLKKESKAK